MKYAIIENGLISNVALADAPLDTNWVELQDGFGIGDLYANSVFDKAPIVEPVIEAPQITDLQAWLAMEQMGILAIVEQFASTNPTFRIWLDRATVWRRDNQILIDGATQAGFTTAQLDGLFALGATL